MLESRHITNFRTSFTECGEREGGWVALSDSITCALLPDSLTLHISFCTFCPKNSQAVWTHLIWREKPLSGGNVLIRCVGRVGRGRRARGRRRSRKKELGRGNTLSKPSLPQGMMKGKSVGAPGTQRRLSLQIGAGITHLDR